jgi:hypothetical protein
MREHGTWGKTPITISVPNPFEPTFKVRDYGCGISPDRMENVFVNYGSSTKRNTNTQTGGFGIGAKSAFSYTDSFTITSFVDGVKYVYVAHLGDNGGVNLIEQVSTKEANGVEISIGVKTKDVSAFRDAVQRCVRYWSETIKFLGVTDGEIVQEKPLLTLDNMSVYKLGNESETFYLIDGIKYPKLDSYDSNSYSYRQLHSYGYGVAINLPNGFFKIASSRERLENNEDNKNKQLELLTKCKARVKNLLDNTVNNPSLKLQDRVQAQRKFGAFELVHESRLSLGGEYYLRSGVLTTPNRIPHKSLERTRKGKQKIRDTHTTAIRINQSVIIDTTNDSEPNTIARRVNHYLSSNPTMELIIVDSGTNIPFMKELFGTIINSSTLPKPQIVRGASTNTKSAGDSYVYELNSGNSSDTMINIRVFNFVGDKPVIVVDSIDDEGAKDILPFIQVVRIPKRNRGMVTRKTMTVEEGKKYLLAKHKDDLVGLSLSREAKKVTALANLGLRKIDNSLANYLFTLDASLKKKQDGIEKEYRRLVQKYPLIEVLDSVHGHYATIVIDELNKQMKGE